MSNHKWKNNICIKCGISRERKDFKRWQSTGSVLGRDGCWYDKHYYTFGTGWYYGKEYGFDRPQCAIIEWLNGGQSVQECDARKVK
jgi:hypothetical protein